MLSSLLPGPARARRVDWCQAVPETILRCTVGQSQVDSRQALSRELGAVGGVDDGRALTNGTHGPLEDTKRLDVGYRKPDSLSSSKISASRSLYNRRPTSNWASVPESTSCSTALKRQPPS